jgi:hypothetical protein
MAYIGSIHLTGSLSVTAYTEPDGGVVWFPRCLRHDIEAEPVRDLDLITPCPLCLHAGTIAPAAA